MASKTLLRSIGLPLTILALIFAFAAPALAGGDGSSPGPTVHVSPPSVSLNDQGEVLATTTVTCWGDAVIDGHVSVTISLGQQQAGGSAWLETTCAAEPRVHTLTLTSVTGYAFHPGPVFGIFEFDVVTSTSAGGGIVEIDTLLLPAQAGR